MQTFLPYRDFALSAKVLDRQRLGKQRVENMQIMKALVAPEESPPSIVKHWVTGMWRGHESTLLAYQRAVCGEWTSRGYKDTCLEKTEAWFWRRPSESFGPDWLSDERVFTAHQGRLLAKAPEDPNYSKLFRVEPIEDYPDWMKQA